MINYITYTHIQNSDTKKKRNCIIDYKCLKNIIPLYIIYQCNAVVHRYAFEGVLQAVYGYDRADLDCEKAALSPECRYHNPENVLTDLDVSNASFYTDFIVLSAFFIILRVSCYFVLRWRVKAQR